LIVVSCIYSAACAFFVILLPKLNRILKTKIAILGMIAIIGIIAIVAFICIHQGSIRNDRYYMIQIFWDNLFHNVNPYRPHTDGLSNNVPGAFPWYFVLAFPGWLLGEAGLIVLSGIALFIASLVKLGKGNNAIVGFGLALILLSIAFWYEIPTRSTLFFNMSLTLFYCIWLLHEKQWQAKHLLFAIILGGIVLSTRSIVIIPMFGTLIFALRSKTISIHSALKIVAGQIIIFLIPVVLLAIVYKSDFTRYNPFSVQVLYGGRLLFPVLAILAITCGFLAKNTAQLLSLIGFSLLSTALAQYGVQIMSGGFVRCLFNDIIDISYIVMALPFLAVSGAGMFTKDTNVNSLLPKESTNPSTVL
jgi:hypothetical protein